MFGLKKLTNFLVSHSIEKVDGTYVDEIVDEKPSLGAANMAAGKFAKERGIFTSYDKIQDDGTRFIEGMGNGGFNEIVMTLSDTELESYRNL